MVNRPNNYGTPTFNKPSQARSVIFLLHAVNCARFCFWRCLLLFCLGVKYLGNRANGFAPNSQGRRVWSLAWTVLMSRSKVKVIMDKNSIFRPFRQPACRLCLERQRSGERAKMVAQNPLNWRLSWVTYSHSNPINFPISEFTILIHAPVALAMTVPHSPTRLCLFHNITYVAHIWVFLNGVIFSLSVSARCSGQAVVEIRS